MTKFADLWGTISILLAGGFGILGLLTEYRDKTTSRINIWGKVSLGGIIVSTLCGTIAHMQAENEKDVSAAKHSALLDSISAQTKAAEFNTRRAQFPLENISFDVLVEVPCDLKIYTDICRRSRGVFKGTLPSKWPEKFKFEAFVWDTVSSGPTWQINKLEFRAELPTSGVANFWHGEFNNIESGRIFANITAPASQYWSDGSISSVLDLPGKTLAIRSCPAEPSGSPIVFSGVSMNFKGGVEVSAGDLVPRLTRYYPEWDDGGCQIYEFVILTPRR